MRSDSATKKRARLHWGAKRERTEYEYDQYAPVAPSSIFWDLSMAVTKIAVLLVLVSAFLLFMGDPLSIRPTVRGLVPDSVAEFFSTESRGLDPTTVVEAKKKVIDELQAAHKPGKAAGKNSKKAARSFGIGSSKQDVLAVQGPPTSATETVWTYRSSEVYFAAGRVIGWRTADGESLSAK